MPPAKSYISIGDFLDLYYKIQEQGFRDPASLFHLSKKLRVVSKWNHITSTSDFWVVPEIKQRWNKICTGDPDMGFEEYAVKNYLEGKYNLRCVSAGCGKASSAVAFGQYLNFSEILGIDIAGNLIERAREKAWLAHNQNVHFVTGDFTTYPFEPNSLDLVLFHSSLHHFRNIERLLKENVLPILKPGGLLVIYEYTGPNRLQWTDSQLKLANEILKELPDKYKRRFQDNSVKKKVYRPGWFRMCAVDPSEAVDSAVIIPMLHKYFKVLEEKNLGWNLLQPLLKGIAHNFMEEDNETHFWLGYLFRKEDEYITQTGQSDGVFGIYEKL